VAAEQGGQIYPRFVFPWGRLLMNSVSISSCGAFKLKTHFPPWIVAELAL
jgi:hypothetical protein